MYNYNTGTWQRDPEIRTLYGILKILTQIQVALLNTEIHSGL